MRTNKDELVWVDSKTPKICATCINVTQVGDGNWICLKRTKVNPPFLVAVNLYANSATCEFWKKGGELSPQILANMKRR